MISANTFLSICVCVRVRTYERERSSPPNIGKQINNLGKFTGWLVVLKTIAMLHNGLVVSKEDFLTDHCYLNFSDFALFFDQFNFPPFFSLIAVDILVACANENKILIPIISLIYINTIPSYVKLTIYIIMPCFKYKNI